LLAGATGNVTDRMINGAVTDFLQVWLRFLPWQIFNPWPTFNVADAAVTIGALLLISDILFPKQARG
jgi:signal peptidase II